MKKLLFIVFISLLASCATMTPEGSKVRIVTKGSLVQNCKFIQQAEVSTIWTGTGEIQGEKELIIQAKNKTAELGGNTALLQYKQHGYASKNMLVDAYKCP